MKRISAQNYWANVTAWWDKLLPPIRPWPSETKIYRQFAEEALIKIAKPKILILGSTPEMRDLAHQFKNSEVTCVDMNLGMIRALSLLMKEPKNADKEIWVKADWLKAPLKNGYYHLILGEAVLGNVAFKKWRDFLTKIRNLLACDGYFITRVVVAEPVWHGKKLAEIFAYVKKNKLNYAELYFLLFLRRWGYGKYIQMSNLDMYQSINRFYRFGEKKFRYPDVYIERLLNQMQRYIPPSDFSWSNQPLAVTKKYLQKYFRIGDHRYGKGESVSPASYHPIYFLRKDKNG